MEPALAGELPWYCSSAPAQMALRCACRPWDQPWLTSNVINTVTGCGPDARPWQGWGGLGPEAVTAPGDWWADMWSMPSCCWVGVGRRTRLSHSPGWCEREKHNRCNECNEAAKWPPVIFEIESADWSTSVESHMTRIINTIPAKQQSGHLSLSQPSSACIN